MKLVTEIEIAQRIYDTISDDNVRLIIQNIIGYSMRRARSSKRKYVCCLIVGITSNAVILVLNVQNTPSIMRTLIAIMSSISFIASSLLAGFQWKSNWSNYRISTEKLKSEGMDFLGKTESYAGLPDVASEKQLLVHCQRIASEEGIRWQLANRNNDIHKDKNC